MPDYILQHRLAQSSNNTNKLAISSNLNQPIVRPFGNSFFPSTVAIWNSLPNNILSSGFLSEFLRKTSDHFWSNIITAYDLEPD